MCIRDSLYHLRDNRGDIVGILSCESGELFMRYFKEYLEEMFSQYLEEDVYKRQG